MKEDFSRIKGNLVALKKVSLALSERSSISRFCESGEASRCKLEGLVLSMRNSDKYHHFLWTG